MSPEPIPFCDALKVSAAIASGSNERQMVVITDLVTKQWDTAAAVTEQMLVSVRCGLHTADEALEFLAAEFRKMARP